MKLSAPSKSQFVLLAGDILTISLVTILGFASHGTLGNAGLRMLTTFLPLVIAWFMIAPFLGVYDLVYASTARQLWRPFWAMVLAGPMAAWLRGVMLNAPILPFFVVVLGGVSALSMLAWRGLYILILSRQKR